MSGRRKRGGKKTAPPKKENQPKSEAFVQLEERKKILESKREKLNKLLSLGEVLEGENEENKNIGVEDTNNEIIEEVNTLLSNLGEKPISVIYRTRKEAEGGPRPSRDGSSLRKMMKVGAVEYQPSIKYEKEIQCGDSHVNRTKTKDEDMVSSSGGGGLLSKKRLEEEDDEELEEEGEEESVIGKPVDDITKKAVMSSTAFQSFFERKTLLIERCLSTKYDPLLDFTVDHSSSSAAGDQLTQVAEFTCDFTKDRSVTAVAWCEEKSFQNLFLGAYYKKPYGSATHGGGICVWSQFLPERPEHIFHCEHPISNAIFYKYNPQIIVGCTYYGEVCKWDMRVRQKGPVERNPVNFKSHQQPIFGMKIVGTSLSHNLLTLSLDGKICEWQKCELDKEPTNIQLLDSKTGGGSTNQMSEIHAKCLGIKKDSIDRFFIGGENGVMYSAYLYGTREGIDSRYEGHFGPITSIDFHQRNDFKDYCLTSSVDWSVILWNQKKNEKPVYTFSAFDSYVFDVKWSPVHPSMFATADGSGKLKVWDLNKDTETPVHRHPLEKNSGETRPAFSKLAWNATGTNITVGSVDGRLCLFKLSEDVALPSPKEGKDFRSTLVKLNNMSDIIL